MVKKLVSLFKNFLLFVFLPLKESDNISIITKKYYVSEVRTDKELSNVSNTQQQVALCSRWNINHFEKLLPAGLYQIIFPVHNLHDFENKRMR